MSAPMSSMDFDSTTSISDKFLIGDALLERVKKIVDEDLAPQVLAIDREGIYPKEVMQKLGAAGAFRRHLPSLTEDGKAHFDEAMRAMAIVSRVCMNTGFTMWCQVTLAWYIEKSPNAEVRNKLLEKVACGEVLGGTALSNPMKHLSGIEPLKITATEVDNGFIINGTLPWVSNLGEDHWFASIAAIDTDPTRKVMFAVDCSSPGFSLRQCAEFIALEGSQTFACHYDNVFIPKECLIADPIPEYLQSIKAGFVFLQIGMGVGVIQACSDYMHEFNQSLSHVNCYLDYQTDELDQDIKDYIAACDVLATEIGDSSDRFFVDILKLRKTISELSLKAGESAMLHGGARSYLHDSVAQRKLREAYFVAMISPSIKHIRKEIDRLGYC
ncbi:MAG: acyl-CoA/acyl-ACP dehydrogenase [Pseudomonadales bacterium]|nr:acyl-CoA/acyl-ACP dehydrogenase [Pseudomonadales bacterium]